MPRHTSIIPRELAPYLIAPATAKTIAKLACGMADDAVCACAVRLGIHLARLPESLTAFLNSHKIYINKVKL